MYTRIATFGSAVLIALSLGAVATSAGAQPSKALVRIIHAAPGVAPVDIFVDGDRILTNVAFMESSAYLELAAGSHQVALAPATQDIAQAIITSTVSLEANQAYTVAAVGLGEVSTQVYRDDLSVPPAGKARLRVIHTSPDGVAVDVKVVDGSTLISNLAFPDASDYVLVDAGTYDLQAIALGTNTIVIQLPDTKVEVGSIYTALVSGRLASIQAKVIPYTPPVGADAPTVEQPSQATQMPATGSGTYNPWLLLGLGILTFASGLVLRRRTA